MNRLDVEKAIQAAGVVLRREGKEATRLRILKLLYIADRESLAETGSPILGSRIVAMKHGPLHSEVLDLINGGHRDEPKWSLYFQSSGKDVRLSREPATDRLSRQDIRLLNRVVEKRLPYDDWEVVDETHAFEEWKKCYPNPEESTSRSIPLDVLLDAVGRGHEKGAIKEDIADSAYYDRFFSGISK